MAKGLDKKGLSIWKEKLNVSKIQHKEEIQDKLKVWREYYRGIQNRHNASGDNFDNLNSRFRDELIDNMVFQNISTIAPSLIIKNPTIYATAKKKPFETKTGTFDTVGAAQSFEILMNYYFEELRLKRQSKKVLIDALIGPWGFMQLGFTAKFEKVENKKGKEGKELINNEIIKGESIFATRRSPNDILIDSKAKDHQLEDADWIAFRWEKSLEDIKNDPNFSNTSNLKSNKTIDTKFGLKGTPSELNSNSEIKQIWSAVEGWTVWDKKNQKIIDIVLTHDKELRVQNKWPWKIDGFPLEVLYFNEKPDELVPLSDVETYLDKQDELNLMGQIEIDTVRRHGEVKWVVRKNALENSNDELKLTNGGSGVIVPVQGDPSTAIFPLRNNTLSQDVLITKRSIKSDIRESQKIGSFESGVAEKFDTATEASLIQQGVSIQRENRRDIIEDFITRIIKKLSVILQQTLDTTMSIPLNNNQAKKINKILGVEKDALNQWLDLNKEDLLGDYEFKLEIGSMQPINKETRKRDTVQLIQLLSQAQGLPEEVLLRLFEAFEIRDPDKLIESIRQQQQQAQQAQQAAQQGQAQQEAQKKQVDLQKTQMKNQTNESVTSAKNETAKAIALINAFSNRKG